MGFFIGIFWVNIYKKIFNKKIKKNAIKVLNGERLNQFDLNGKIINVDKFMVPDENNNNKKIEFKKLEGIKNGRL